MCVEYIYIDVWWLTIFFTGDVALVTLWHYGFQPHNMPGMHPKRGLASLSHLHCTDMKRCIKSTVKRRLGLECVHLGGCCRFGYLFGKVVCCFFLSLFRLWSVQARAQTATS
jgi:hypothetical protein